MGCDIHMYVEYRSPTMREDYWSSFGERINPGRNYTLFGYLAGVRDTEVKQIVPSRGLPENLGWSAGYDSSIRINDEVSDNEEGFCTLKQAQEWVKYGCKIEERDGKPYRVSHPDWHSHSWMSVNEFGKVLKSATSGDKQDGNNPGDEYFALLAATKELKKRGNEVRIVFWFDN